MSRQRGFTLVEVLAALVILTALATFVATVAQSARTAADRSREVAAGRSLIIAYQLAASDNDGILPAGYDRTVATVELPDGSAVHGPSANRYPFRLAPYFDFAMEGIILVNKNATQINKSDTYAVSCYPAFGINYRYVGGDKDRNGVLTLPNEVATRSAQGTNILVFASSGEGAGSRTIHGYSILTPPAIYGSMWSGAEWKEGSNTGDYGHIHARHGGKAVSVFLDGSVRLLSIEELRDMRLWSQAASEADDRAYRVAAPSSGSGVRR